MIWKSIDGHAVMIDPPMFRQKALQRISSPDQLDKLVSIVSPRLWVALSALLVAAAGAIVWSSVATVPTTISAPGYYLPQGGLRKIAAPASGILSRMIISDGEHVIAGEPLGSIALPGGGTVDVAASETGVVIEANAAPDSYVSSGEDLGQILPVGWPLVVYSYVPSEKAAGLLPGVPVQVSFGVGIGATYGYAVGKVLSSSQFPVSSAHLTNILQVASVVHHVQSLGPVGEVVVELALSASTPSGLKWGSGSGPPAQLPAGLPAQVTFVVGSHHPIDNVL